MARPNNETRGQPLNSVSPYRRSTADRKRIADAIGEQDEGFLMELQAAGYTGETIVLAELIPQVQIAWADGEVSQRERDIIVESAAYRCVSPQSRASLRLAVWLERRPSEDFLRISREAMTRMFRRLPPHLQRNVRRSLLREFGDVAASSGGFLGWRSVSTEEQEVIDAIASELDAGDSPEVRANDVGPSAPTLFTRQDDSSPENSSRNNISRDRAGVTNG